MTITGRGDLQVLVTALTHYIEGSGELPPGMPSGAEPAIISARNTAMRILKQAKTELAALDK